MYKITPLLLLFYGCAAIAQPGVNASDSRVKGEIHFATSTTSAPSPDTSGVLNSEDDIKAKLILLALNNAESQAADANIRLAEIARRKANSSLLGALSVEGNVNEFVINNSPAANFYPKYNIGIAIPLDMFARNNAEKRTATEMIKASISQKAMVNDALRAKVLIRWEGYKEKKELLELQRIVLADDVAAYEKAQKDFKDDILTIEEVNKLYREVIASRGVLASRQRDLNIAVIEIEEIIGVPLITVLEKGPHFGK